MAKGDDLEDRLIDFAVGVLDLCDKLPRTAAGRHVEDQLLRSGTAGAPHYSEARSAESKRDFAHKLRLALKELNESRVWLKIVLRRNMAPADEAAPLLQECQELCRIIYASIQTVQGRRPTSDQ